MFADFLFWLALSLPFVTGGAFLFLLVRERERFVRAHWHSVLGKILLAALFVWSSLFVFVRKVWIVNEDFILGVFVLLPLLGGGLLWVFALYHRTRRTHGGLGRLIAGNAIILMLLVTLIPLAGEAYIRFLYDQTDSLICTKHSRRWLDRHFQLNASDFPDSLEYSQQVEPGKRRITLVGDSFAAGYGVKHLEDRLVGRLRKAHPEWEVHLLARPGADTTMHLKFLTNYFRNGFEANEVVLIYFLNDVTDLPGSWNQLLRASFPKPDQQWRWLVENSYFANTLYYRLRISCYPELRYRNYCNYVLEGYEGQLWEMQKKRLRSLQDLVQAHGARLSVVTFPFVHAVGPEYPFKSIHAKLNQFWRGLHVPHLDLLKPFEHFPGRDLIVNQFDVHPNAFAHKLAAAKISRLLTNQIAGQSSFQDVPAL